MHAAITVLGGVGSALGGLTLATGVVLALLAHALALQVIVGGGAGLVIGVPLLIMGLNLCAERDRAKEREL
jgi:hypothetical protein